MRVCQRSFRPAIMTRTMEAMRVVFNAVGWLGFAVAVLLDLNALYCGIRRNVRGHGPSGVPILSLLIYIGICQYRQRFLDLLWMGLFYALCHTIIPLVHGRLHRQKTY